MPVDVGKGTRLLCVEAIAGDNLEVGHTYTCEEVFAMDGGWYGNCGIHGNNCEAGGVKLVELLDGYRDRYAAGQRLYIDCHCLACFVPLGGDLPASIARLARPTKILEPA